MNGSFNLVCCKLSAFLAISACLASAGFSVPVQAQEEHIDAGQLPLRSRPTLVEPEPAKRIRGVHYKANTIATTGKRHTQGASPNVSPTCSNPQLSYFGGPVISNVQSVVVFWGAYVNSHLTAPNTGIAQFLTDLQVSTFLSVPGEYSTYGQAPGSTASNQLIGQGSTAAVSSYTITPSLCAGNTNCTVTDAEVQQELNNQIAASSLPAPTYDAQGNDNTLYMVYFPPNVTINFEGSDSCVEYCAYHNTGTYNGTGSPLVYGIMPDLFTTACNEGCGTNATQMENVTSVTSHEFAEAITDADIGLDTGNDYAYPGAWGDNNNCGEIADICDNNASGDTFTVSGRQWTVQELWSNYENKCESVGVAYPPFTFGGPSTDYAGTSFSLTVNALLPNGQTNTNYTDTVHFTSSDPSATLPADYTFTSADAGMHSFQVTPGTAGTQSINVVDAQYPTLTASYSISVTQATPAVTLSATSLGFGSVAVGSLSASQSVTLTNTGTGTLTFSAIGVTGTNPSSFVFGNTCGSSLAAGASCTFHGHFAPVKAGSLSAAVTIIDNATNSPQTISLSGTGLGPTASLSATSLSFPSTQVGSTSTLPVTITNSGSGTLSVSSISNTGASPSQFTHTSNCGGNPLAANASCTAQVIFAPTAAGTFTATLNIVDNATGSPQTISLSGTGTGGPAVSLSTTSLTFPATQIGSSGTLPVTVTNTGSANLTVSLISNTGANPSLFTHTSNCGNGVSIAPSSSCTIQVIFTPTAAGSFTATLNIKDNAAGSPQTVSLSGTATAGPAVSLSTNSLTFPSTQVGSTSTLPITVTNTGSANLTVSMISNTGANPSLFTHTSTCGNGVSIAPGGNCTIQVIFTPTASGSFTATLNIKDNAAGSPQTVSLSGTATAGPAVSLSTNSLTFPATSVGSSSMLSFTITNSGSGTLNVSAITNVGTNAADFSHTSNCGGSPLTAGEHCTVQVSFSPSATGSRTASMSIADNATGSPQSISLSGTGQ
jgi:hypothetical protein